MPSPDVIVIGAGLVGLSLARELHRQGLQPLVVDAGAAGRGASWAGAGMLAGYELAHPALRALGIAAARLYPTWIAELERETGLPTGYRRSGTLYLASPSHPAPAGPSAGLDGWEQLAPAQVAELEPGLISSGAVVWRIPGDHSIDNRALVAALDAAVRARGIVLREHSPVRAVSRAAQGLEVFGEGWRVSAPLVVNAAGAWAASFSAPAPAPVRPRKGQLMALRSTAHLRHVVEAPGVYLVPRASGRVLVGATLEDCGFEASVSAACAADLHARAAALVPSLAEATVEDTWIGFRPCSPDDLPLLGPTACPGYTLATAHFRDGILLAPITAKIVAKALATGHWTRALDLAPFLPGRFQA